MAVPHHFPSLVDGPSQVVVVVGSGFSAPIVPTVQELASNLQEIARIRGMTDSGDFYQLADAVLRGLKAEGKSDAESRLWLAERLRMLDDRSWFGEIGVPLSGNTPRHRALARFAVEKRVRAVVSLNWDALLEAALESVGLKNGTGRPSPWEMTAYAAVVTDAHVPVLSLPHLFPVIKPHGCVRELERARRRHNIGEPLPCVTFKLTWTELNDTSGQENVIDVRVKAYISECPLIGIGWKASEGYLRRAIVDIAKKVQRPESDAFTLIDVLWDSNHTEIAVAYGKDEIQSFAKVEKDSGLTSDCLFQWLQARYALARMIATVPIREEKASLQRILQQLDQPDCRHSIVSWADHWLSTWVRLCWRSGAMQGFDQRTNAPIGPLDIPVTPRDAHVPLAGLSRERRDLAAAAKLVVTLGERLGRFQFDKYPGGLWEPERRVLYVALPGWKESNYPSDLAALKPLAEELRCLGYVRKIFLLWLNSEDTPPDEARRRALEAQMQSLMPLTGFAAEGALSWIELDAIKGDSDATMA